MNKRSKVPIEKPKLRAYIYAFLDYLMDTHRDAVITIVRDWLSSKSK